jgi:methionyl-tRNA synthetase
MQADREGVQPIDIVNRYHPTFLKTFERLGIMFDLFTTTLTPNHYQTTQEIFLGLLEKGYVYKDKMVAGYSETLGRFLPDRYIQGECYNCHFAKARGDQCDNCGILIDTEKLINPHSIYDNGAVTFKETEHFFMDLPKLEPKLREWLSSGDKENFWRPNTIAFTNNWLHEGLKARAYTRDLDWGVPVPLDDPAFKDKRIYVWFDAVVGYLSASREWAQRIANDPQAWLKWWEQQPVGANPSRAYYFMGKDNIPFHSIIWPAMLLGSGELNLPYDVIANEFMNLERQKMTTSGRWAVWLPDIEDRYQPDALRYYLTAVAPESSDSNWIWADFVQRINSELIGTYGNLVNRVLSFTYKNFEGKVPPRGQYNSADRELLVLLDETFREVTEMLNTAHFRDTLKKIMALATAANQYLDQAAPWKLIKTDRDAAAKALFVVIQVINGLKTLTYPFLPFSAEQVHGYLGFEQGDAETGTFSGVVEQGMIKVPPTAKWQLEEVPDGQALREPKPIFVKLDEKVGEEELSRLEQNRLNKE